MCFSAEASLVLGSTLLVSGGFAVHKARQTSARYIPMALFPLIVGAQQLAEGAVWTGLNTGCAPASTVGTFLFLFVAWVVWPFWVPFMTWWVEPDRYHKRILSGFMLAGLIWGLGMYIPYLWNPDWLSAEVAEHSIHYTHYLWVQQYIPDTVLYTAYLSIIGIAPIVSSHFHMKLFGIFLCIATHITYAVYVYAVTSVLCFFAAGIALYLLYIIWQDKCSQRS